ncbi:hypothetical protein [Streptomyces sp. NPDC015125]
MLTVDVPPVAPDHFGRDIIRVHPRRVISRNLEAGGTAARDIG